MSARRVWIATCEICETTAEFDGTLDAGDLLADAIRAAGWELPGYGGTFCPKCSRAVEALKKVVNKNE